MMLRTIEALHKTNFVVALAIPYGGRCFLVAQATIVHNRLIIYTIYLYIYFLLYNKFKTVGVKFHVIPLGLDLP